MAWSLSHASNYSLIQSNSTMFCFFNYQNFKSLIPQRHYIKFDQKTHIAIKVPSFFFSYGHISLQRLLRRHGSSDQSSPDGTSHRSRPHSTRRPIHGAGTEPRRHAIPHIVHVPQRHGAALHAGVDEPDDPQPVPPRPARVAGRVEHPIGPELRGVAGLERLDSGDEAGSSAAYSSEEVAAAGEEGEVVTEITAAPASFFVEEVLRGGGELVDVANWDRDLDPLVRVVESGLGIIRVGFSFAIHFVDLWILFWF